MQLNMVEMIVSLFYGGFLQMAAVLLGWENLDPKNVNGNYQQWVALILMLLYQ